MLTPHLPRAQALVACSLAALLASVRPARADAPPTMALRAGWAYGLGVELEWRPRTWGLGAAGGYVPGLGFGGYLALHWGQRELASPGVVAEAGAFRGVHNALRAAADGWGAYAQAGYQLSFAGSWSARAVAGGGLPLTDPDHLGSFEVLAKLTVGRTF